MKFDDIERFTSWGRYKCNVEWNSLDSTLNSYVENYQLDMNPDFQRGHVWTRDKQIAYVEYILRGGQYSKDIIFNCPGWMGSFTQQMVLVDGKQRLEAVRLFLNNELAIFNGHYLKDFEYKTKVNRLVPRDYEFIFHINSLETRREVLKFYLDLNSGGVVHTEEELNKVRLLLEESKVKH